MPTNKVFTIEEHVKRPVKKLLTTAEWMWWMPSNNGYGASGTSDFICMRRGLGLAIETKLGGREPTAQQHAFARNFRARGGGWAFVVNEHRLDILAEWLVAEARDMNMRAHALTDVLSTGIG